MVADDPPPDPVGRDAARTVDEGGGAGAGDLVAGLVGVADLRVTELDTAVAWGSGDVPVLATPRVVALAEASTMAALATRLPTGATSVGTRVALDHLAPVVVGGNVTARAVLTSIDGRRLSFAVTVRSGAVEVATGTVVRAVVDRPTFLARL